VRTANPEDKEWLSSMWCDRRVTADGEGVPCHHPRSSSQVYSGLTVDATHVLFVYVVFERREVS